MKNLPRKSWIAVNADSDFPIQNLPFGIFKSNTVRGGVAIGNYVVDLSFLQDNGFLDGLELPSKIFYEPTLNNFFSLGKQKVREVRLRVMDLLREGNDTLQQNESFRKNGLIDRDHVEMLMPLKVYNYTDFYSSEEHATNVGSMFRDPKNALLPNWKHLPVAYHGRASSIVVSGTPIHRPSGQIKLPDSNVPLFGATKKLDFELEVAFITCGKTLLGESIPVSKAEDYIIGFVLFNDWSARDIQQWEYAPLGPFLGKNFASTISPWVVTMDALEPFRTNGPIQDPVLPYLQVQGPKHFDVDLEVCIRPEDDTETVVCRSNYKYLYWNINQQLAHHTVNGCNIETGDLYASGTISGPSPGSYGSMLELSWNGERAIRMPNGTTRYFLHDGDTVTMRACARNENVRIGFGECSGKIFM